MYLVISVAPSPAGELFATGSGDMRARIWRYDAQAILSFFLTLVLMHCTGMGPGMDGDASMDGRFSGIASLVP